MGRLRKFAMLLLAACPVAGCGFAKRPYSHDPLLRDGGGVWGNHEVARGPDMNYRGEPVAPHPPKGLPQSRSPGELVREK
ncbi:MAG: hypothetical protein U0792_01365 [Gemmataceae bacterium]